MTDLPPYPPLPEHDFGSLTVVVGPRNKLGRHVVTTRLCGVAHTDTIDADNAHERQRYREKVVCRFNLSDDAHEFLEREIESKARAVDSKSSVELVTPNLVSLADVSEESTRWFWPPSYMPGRRRSRWLIPIPVKVRAQSLWTSRQGTAAVIQCHQPPHQTAPIRAATCYCSAVKTTYLGR